MNKQSAKIIAVTNKEMRDRLSRINLEIVIGNCILGYAAPDALKPQKPRKDDYVVWVI